MPRPRPLPVVLFQRAECHLCVEAEGMLARIGTRLPLRVTLVDIDSDDRLLQRYMLEIPVISVDGVEIARAPIFESRLADALEELAAGR